MSSFCIESYRKSISELSYDESNNEYMTNSVLTAFDFDEIKNQFVSSLGPRSCNSPRSNDALFKDDTGDFYFIEFKNGKVNKHELMQKNYDSTFILSMVLSEKLLVLKEKLHYILVYNENKHPAEQDNGRVVQSSRHRDFIGKEIASKSKKRFIKFDQAFFENYLFTTVHTVNKSEFEDLFISKWECKNQSS